MVTRIIDRVWSFFHAHPRGTACEWLSFSPGSRACVAGRPGYTPSWRAQ